jgi:quercetin dioxygenase-like cupin family protein
MKVVNIDQAAAFSGEKYSRVPIDDSKGLLRLICLEPGQTVPLHKHPKGDEYFYVIAGRGKITIGQEEEEVTSGQLVKACAGTQHQWRNGTQRLTILSVIVPTASYDLAEEATKMEPGQLPSHHQ